MHTSHCSLVRTRQTNARRLCWQLSRRIYRQWSRLHCLCAIYTCRCAPFHLPSSDWHPAMVVREFSPHSGYWSLPVDDVRCYQHYQQRAGHTAHARMYGNYVRESLSQQFLQFVDIAARNGDGIVSVKHHELHGARIRGDLFNLTKIDHEGTMATHYHGISL